MKRTILWIIGMIFVSSNLVFSGKKANVNDTTVNFHVWMDCESCKAKIEKNIAFEKGVKALDVSMLDQTVRIKYKKSSNNPEMLKQAIEKLHYKVEVLELPK
jgi:copper chaperone CopZ